MNKKSYWHSRFTKTKSINLPAPKIDSSFSDSLYDVNKGITHVLLRYSDSKATRYVGDVEICMTNDPNITSYFTQEHRNAIKNQLQNQKRSNVSTQMTDEELLLQGPARSLERDEITLRAKEMTKEFDKAVNQSLALESLKSSTSETPLDSSNET